MGIENFIGKYISHLEPANPVGASDTKGQGDDHIRGIKLVLQNTFPYLDGAVNATDTELNYLDLTAAPGTATGLEAVVLDASKDFAFGTGDISATDITAAGALTGLTIDGVIGSVAPAAGTFTTLTGTVVTASTSLTVNGSTAITSVDTDLSSVSASDDTIASAKAIKAYVDSDRANAVSAYVKSTGTVAGAQTLSNNYNNEFTSVTKTATGRYTVVMANARTDYVVSLTPVKTTDCLPCVDTITSTTEFTIKFIDSYGAYVNPDYIFITVHGQKS